MAEHYCKFILWSKELNDWEPVYDIKYNKSGYPIFLVWRKGKWLHRSAKHFTPEAPYMTGEEF